MTHTHTRHDLKYMRDMFPHVICVHLRDLMTHTHARHDSKYMRDLFRCVICVHLRALMTHTHARHDSKCMRDVTHTCDMTHVRLWAGRSFCAGLFCRSLLLVSFVSFFCRETYELSHVYIHTHTHTHRTQLWSLFIARGLMNLFHKSNTHIQSFFPLSLTHTQTHTHTHTHATDVHTTT